MPVRRAPKANDGIAAAVFGRFLCIFRDCFMTSYDNETFPAGYDLFHEGDAGREAFVIEKGEVEVWVTRGGEKVSVAYLGKGELLGEMAVIDANERSTSATTRKQTVLRRVSRKQFQTRFDAMDPVMRLCLEVFLKRLRKTVANITTSYPGQAIEKDVLCASEAVKVLQFESEIRRAAAGNELELFYQPIVRLNTSRIAGFEGLVRWNHPEKGFLTPDKFIPQAETSGLVRIISDWVIERACKDLGELYIAGLDNPRGVEPLFVSANVTCHDMESAHFSGHLEKCLKKYALSGGKLKLELTESTFMSNPEEIRQAILKIRELGVGLAIDDFGAGYSNLGYLAQLPATELKIDRSLISKIDRGKVHANIVRMIIKLAGQLGMAVIAEGVETARHALALNRESCALAQGYFFGRPQPLKRTLTMVRNWQATRLQTQEPEMAAAG